MITIRPPTGIRSKIKWVNRWLQSFIFTGIFTGLPYFPVV